MKPSFQFELYSRNSVEQDYVVYIFRVREVNTNFTFYIKDRYSGFKEWQEEIRAVMSVDV